MPQRHREMFRYRTPVGTAGLGSPKGTSMSLSPSRRRPAATVAVTVAALLAAVLPAVAASPAAALGTGDSAFTGFTDKSDTRSAGTSVVSSGELAVTDGSAPSGSGTTYYVDSAGGDDAASGTSADAAWRTLANVNATVFEPGDRILLKAGSSWSASGTTVAREAYDYTTWSGRSGEPRGRIGRHRSLGAPRFGHRSRSRSCCRATATVRRPSSTASVSSTTCSS